MAHGDPLLCITTSECDAMVEEASKGTPHRAVGRCRVSPEVAVPIVHYSCRVFVAAGATQQAQRQIAVYCTVDGTGNDSKPTFHAIDARCYHASGALQDGVVVRTILDVEDIGAGTPGGTLCVECPGHGYLFSLLTGSNIVRGHRFENGRMTLGGLKGVLHMQRSYRCAFDPDTGLQLFNDTPLQRCASDSAK